MIRSASSWLVLLASCAATAAPTGRQPVFPGEADRAHRDQPCSRDDECVDSGCGYQCLSKRGSRQRSAYVCIADDRMERALAHASCGCVAGACLWFER